MTHFEIKLHDRWLLMKRFGEERVLKIHALELADGALYTSAERGKAFWLVHRFNAELGPFWDKRKKEADQVKEREVFIAHIRPIALAAYRVAISAGKPGGLAIHASDLAVVRDDYKLNLGTGAPIASSKLLSKVYAKTGADRAAGEDDHEFESASYEEP